MNPDISTRDLDGQGGFSTPEFPTQNRVLDVILAEPKIIDGQEYRNSTVILFEGRRYIVSQKAIFTLNCTQRCNASCSFCFNGVTFMGDGSFVEHNPPLQRAVNFAHLAGIKTIAYSGGEPTLAPQKLYDLVAATLPSFSEGRLHTNGLGLFKSVTDKDGVEGRLIDKLSDLGLFGCSISLAHYDPGKNADIMILRNGYKGLSEDQLAYVASKGNSTFSPRLSCFMSHEGIHDIGEILKYVEFGKGLGFKRFIFRTGSNIPEQFSKDTRFAAVNSQSILNIDIFVSHLVEEDGYTEIFALHKTDAHIHVLRKGEVVLDFDQASEEMDPDDKVRRLIYMPNGVTYTSWLDSSALLFDDDATKIIDASINSYKKDANTALYPAAVLPEKDRSRRDILNSGDTFPVDLHVHSVNSDGLLDVQTIIREALAGNLQSLVLTEHNFIGTEWEVMKREAANLGVEFPFPGAEVSTIYTNKDGNPERKFHVLVYGTKLQNPEFKRFINLPLNLRNNYLAELVEDIRHRGVDIPEFEDMLKGISEDGSYTHPYKRQMTRSVIARYIAKSLGITDQAAKDKFLPPLQHEVTYSSHVDTCELVQRVKDLGGVVGLAHPGWDRPMEGFGPNWRRVMEIIFLLRKQGMDGIETHSSNHTPQQNSDLYRLGKELGLMPIGGSDYHGKPLQNRRLGRFGLTTGEYLNVKNALSKTNNI